MSSRIKELRTANGLLQKDLAEKVKVSINTIRRWESGEREPRSKDLTALSRVFGVSTDYLTGRTDAPATENKAVPASESETVMPKEVGAREGACVLSAFKREEREKLSALCDNYSRLDEIDRAEIRGEINSLIKVALKNAKYAPQKDAKLA